MAAVGPGCEDQSYFLHSGVPGYLQHPHQDLVLGVHLDWHPRRTTGFQNLCQKGLVVEEEMGKR